MQPLRIFQLKGAIVASSLLSSFTCCHAALLAYDSFSYTNDSNYFRDGGFGWSSAWDGLSTNVGLSYIKNNRPIRSQGAGASLDRPAERYLDTSPSGSFGSIVDTNGLVGKAGTDVWVSFLVRPIQLNQYNAGILFGRGSGLYYGFWLSNGMPQLAPGVPLLFSTNYFVVEHIQFGTNDSDIREEYLNPIPGTASPAGAQGTNVFSGNMSFNEIGIIGNSLTSVAGIIDELRFGESYSDVSPLTPVTLTNIQSSAGQMSFSFQSLTGLSHQVETRPSFNVGAWTILTNLLGNGDVKQVTVPTTDSGVRSFRISTE